MTKFLLAATALSVTLLASAAGASTAHFDSAWFFGDSLTDNGNLYSAYGQPPSPPYYMGRSSNGPVWADHIADDFSAKGLANRNYAYAYATASSNASFGPFDVPNLSEQIAAFKADANPLGKKPVAFIWIANNDAFAAISAAQPPYLPTIGAAMADAVQAVGAGITSLVDAGIKDFMVFNMAPLEATPAFTIFNPAGAPLAEYATGVFNALLAQQLAGLAPIANIESFDANAAFEDVIANPADYGINNVSTPCLIPPATQICTAEEAEKHLFWDQVHPSGTIHAALADQVRASIAPVPLPAPVLLLLVGVAAIGRVARRRIA